MKVTLINHASLLFSLNKGKQIFLTDFWNDSPAFGSWLPNPPPFYNPIYLASLSYQENFYLVVSHPHDDHIDDLFLKKYFNKNMKIIINKFSAKSLVRRLEKIGFKNLIVIEKDGKDLGDFQCLPVFDGKISNDDCSLAFRDKSYCIYHGNDNWFEINDKNLEKIKRFNGNRKLFYAAQTNSASGHPLIYPQFSDEEKKDFLEKKIRKMLLSGFTNVKNLNADYFMPYAGYSRPYVKGEKYNDQVFNPTYENLIKLLGNEKVQGKEKLLNIFCGGTINLKDGEISYPFNFEPEKVFKITDTYYKEEKKLEKCLTYNKSFSEEISDKKIIEKYLGEFNNFVKSYLEKNPEFYPSIKGKKVRFKIKNSNHNLIANLEIGTGLFFDDKIDVNKEIEIEGKLFKGLIDKKIVFDDLYTGFMAKVSRNPKDKYNRDIIMYLVMFGYKYKNTKS